MKTVNKIEQNAAALKRWRTRLKRAMTMIDKLERQRKRSEAPPKPRPAKAVIIPPPPAAAPVRPPEVDTAIPPFLKRKPDPVAEQIKADQIETKKRKAQGRKAAADAKRRGDTRKMPLTGKAALAAIRG